MRSKYTEEELRKAVQESSSFREICERLNLKGWQDRKTWNAFVRRVNFLGLSIDHIDTPFKEIIRKQRYTDLVDYLDNTVATSSAHLRRRLLAEKVFEPKCSSCKLEVWLEQPIPLELDHIDGNHKNNKLDNLRLLCPNCHSLTPTHSGKDKVFFKK